jgi:predicted PurR-regulated permease PerM
MSLLSFIPIIGRFLDKGLEVVDQLVEDKDKANEIKAAIKQQILVQQHDEIIQEMNNITQRWTSDNEHFITRLVRPVSYGFMLFLFAIMVLCDGNVGHFHIDPAYLPIIKALLLTMTIAYFGSRGLEKINRDRNKS